jgi:hypothetical protein
VPGPHCAAFNAKDAVNGNGEIIICEAIIDALTFWAHGFRNVTAAYGINGLTDHHRALCLQDTVKTVFIAYDNDDAGNSSATSLADELMAAGKSVYRLCVPAAHKDINGFACASDDAATALGEIIRDADYLGGSVRVAVPEVISLAAKNEIIETATNDVRTEQDADELPLVITDDEETVVAPSAELKKATTLLIADGDDFRATFGDRNYRIRALLKNADLSVLKIGLRVTVGDVFHQDTLDVCQAKQRAAFIAAASEITKTDVAALKADIAQLLDACETTWLSAKNNAPTKTKQPTMTTEERDAALTFLQDPNLLQRIAADYETCGLVGDAAPKLVSYLCAISRKLPQPLAVLTMAPSAAGKSSLQDATLAFVPDEDALVLSTLTGQALYYSDTDLRHKVLAIAEEEGASRASYALKLLQSDGKLSLAVPIKDSDSGNISTQIKTVQGPVALFLTTTAPQIDDELANRCIVLTVDESAEHTARVHVAQRERETLDGLRHRTAATAIRAQHHHAQRLLENVAIVNPFARVLTFRSDRARTRRDHMKYLALIRAVTFLHQYQRPVKTTNVNGETVSYIETTLADIAAANDLAAAVLGRSLDELAPQTRTLLMQINTYVIARAAREARPPESIQFTRRDMREATGWSADQIDIHLKRLERLEYVISGRREKAGAFVYTLDYQGQGQDGSPFLLGIIDVGTIQERMQAQKNLGTTNSSEGGNPQFRPRSEAVPMGVRGRSVGHENDLNDGETSDDHANQPKSFKNGMYRDEKNGTVNRSRTINGYVALGGVR